MIEKSDLINTVNQTLNRSYCAGNETTTCLKDITAATKANPCNIQSTAHGYSTGDRIWIKDVVGMTEINNKHFTITKVDADNFTLGVDSTAYTAYTSGGTCVRDDLDKKIIITLQDLSQKGDFLQDEFKRVTIADRDYYSLPDNFKRLLFVGMKSSDDATIYRPLEYETFAEYKNGLYYSNDTGTPKLYTWESGFMYPRPIPDAVYNMYWWYSYYHKKTVTVDSVEYDACDYILFKNHFQEVVEFGLLYRVALSLGLDNDVKKFKSLYELQVAIHRADIKRHPKIARYRDGM